MLHGLAVEGDAERVRAALAAIVPEYRVVRVRNRPSESNRVIDDSEAEKKPSGDTRKFDAPN